MFVNTRVLLSICNYFRSGTPPYLFGGLPFAIPAVFESAGGIETDLMAEILPGVETFSDLDENVSGDDYDPAEEELVDTHVHSEVPLHSETTVKDAA